MAWKGPGRLGICLSIFFLAEVRFLIGIFRREGRGLSNSFQVARTPNLHDFPSVTDMFTTKFAKIIGCRTRHTKCMRDV